MQILSNDRYIEKRTKIGQAATLLSLGLIMTSTVLFFMRPEWFNVIMIMITLGLFSSFAGSYYAERFVGVLTHHKKVREALKGLDRQHSLLIYQKPCPFVLVEPGGVTVIVVKTPGGVVRYQNKRWSHKQRFNLARQLGGQESLGDPSRQAQDEAQYLARWLTKRLPEGMQVPVRGLSLFVHPSVVLEIETPPAPALLSKDLKGWLRGPGRRSAMPKETRAALAEVLRLNEAVEA